MTISELITELKQIEDRGRGDAIILYSTGWAKVIEAKSIYGSFRVIRSNSNSNSPWMALPEIPCFSENEDEREEEFYKNNTIKYAFILE